MLNWNFMRFLRLVLGVMIGIQAFQTQTVFPGVIAGFLLFQVFTNTGCCGVNSGAKTDGTNVSRTINDIEFEEVKNN